MTGLQRHMLVGSDTFRVPGPLSAARLASHAKRALDSPSAWVPKRKKRGKKKSANRTRESSSQPPEYQSDHDSVEGSDGLLPESRFEIPVIKTKSGTIRPLGDPRSVPCYECIRSIANESFAKYPDRCYDVMHETRVGVNTQRSTCARKHVSPCVSRPGAEKEKESAPLRRLYQDASFVLAGYGSLHRKCSILGIIVLDSSLTKHLDLFQISWRRPLWRSVNHLQWKMALPWISNATTQFL
jgi:hypothetical protein